MNSMKAQLRKQVRQLKLQHQAEAIMQSAAICQLIEQNEWFKQAHTVLLYHPLPDEVDVRALLERWHNKKHILLPVVQGDDLVLRHYTPQCMRIGAFGIEEPQGNDFAHYEDITFVAVPGMAFDPSGHRLGRGKGFYDRLLPRLTTAHKAGICFSYQLVDDVPCESHDIIMDQIITLNRHGAD